MLDKPPTSLLRSYSVPDYTGTTWGELLPYTKELRAIIKRHDADKKALRNYYSAP